MVRDLGLPIEIVVCPTVRESDGLALSSRNAYLGAADRARAVGLSEALDLAARAWDAGDDPAAVEKLMRKQMESRGIAVDYAAVVDAETLEEVRSAAEARALVAGRLGPVRLIDNRALSSRRAGG
jgi:pantoate--beta-alanine ligase